LQARGQDQDAPLSSSGLLAGRRGTQRPACPASLGGRAGDEGDIAGDAAGVGASVVLDQEEVMDGELARRPGLSLVRRLPSGDPIRKVGSARRLSKTPHRADPLPGPPARTRPPSWPAQDSPAGLMSWWPRAPCSPGCGRTWNS
jgi:hypothetical protein